MAASSASSWMAGTQTVVKRLASAGLSSFLPKSPPAHAPCWGLSMLYQHSNADRLVDLVWQEHAVVKRLASAGLSSFSPKSPPAHAAPGNERVVPTRGFAGFMWGIAVGQRPAQHCVAEVAACKCSTTVRQRRFRSGAAQEAAGAT